METQFDREQMLLGQSAIETLSGCHVAVFGVGGVGSFTAEATDIPPEGIDTDFGFNVATLRYTDANGESAPISLNFSGDALFFNC